MSVLTPEIQKDVEQQLIEAGLLTEEALTEHRGIAADKGDPFFVHLVNDKVITDEDLTKAISTVLGVPYVNLGTVQVNQSILSLLPKEVAERFMAVPLGEMQSRLVVAMLEADNVQAVDFLSKRIGRPLKVYMASEKGVRRVLQQYSSALTEDVGAAFKDKDGAKEQEEKSKKGDEKSITTIVQDSPISTALSTILEYAVKVRASDIHIEPQKLELKIRIRVDGVLREIMKLPKSTEPPLVSRIKILSNLKIDEHRTPQDGQFVVNVMGRDIDLRIAISPVVWGEQVVIRILDKSSTSMKLEDMGYAGRALRTIRKGIQQPNGMVLTSGPTGSGKSTSMYALIQEIMDDAINIVTLEDPVEYKMQGINQIQVNADVGLTFASGLRSILRQDPDVILVGEIRDKETATLAVQAALTGHLVFSTLHTNSAAGVLPRLLDMGIEPFLIASTVNTVIGQRLVRRITDKKEKVTSSELQAKSINTTLGRLLPKAKEEAEKLSKDLGHKDLPLANQKDYTLYKGTESPSTPGGYEGRVGLYEVLDVNEEIEKLILKRATSNEIQKRGQELGMVTMREDGYFKALNGLTTLEEVNRVAAIDSA